MGRAIKEGGLKKEKLDYELPVGERCAAENCARVSKMFYASIDWVPCDDQQNPRQEPVMCQQRWTASQARDQDVYF